MRRSVSLRSFAAVLTLALMPLVPHGARATADWQGASSLLGGTARYDGGEWIYQDFVYDDYGADTMPAGSSQRVTLASTVGDFRYPADAKYAANAADIAEVRARLDGNDLAMRITLGALIDASTTVFGVAIATGDAPVKAWPDGAGVSSAWDAYAQVRAPEGSLVRGASTVKFAVVADAAANTFDFTLPGLAAGASLSMVIGSGLAAPDGQWLQGLPGGAAGSFNSGGPSTVRVFDLAFNSRAIEPRGGAWQEDAQARALTLGDAAPFSQSLDLDAMRAGRTDAPIVGGGYYNRIFRSRQDLGEGTAGSFPQYRSKLTPYGLWVPKGYDPAASTPLMFQLHSLSVHHNQYRGGQNATSYFTMQEQIGDGLGAIVVTPLAGGPDGWYRNESLVDALEVLADVQQHYNIDPDRIYIAGYSMGGYGTYRIGTLLADRFAGAVSWAGVPVDSERLENMHSIPLMIVHGTNDELVPITGVRAQAARMRALNYEYRFHEHPGMDHLTFVWTDEWSREREWLKGRTRVHSPARVHFKVQPSMWTTGKSDAERATILGHIAAMGYDLTSAYWVRDVRNRASDQMAEVDATSRSIAPRDPLMIDRAGAALGPPTPHVTEGWDRTLDPAAIEEVLTLKVRGVTSLTIDVARAGFSVGQRLGTIISDADAPTTVTLDGIDGPGTSQTIVLPVGTTTLIL